jgi:hypothetical protein
MERTSMVRTTRRMERILGIGIMMFLAVALGAQPASGEMDGCAYHQRGDGVVNGSEIFLKLWKKGW